MSADHAAWTAAVEADEVTCGRPASVLEVAPGATYAERLANAVAALEAAIGGPGDTTEAIDAPAPRWASARDADRAADREENRRWRQAS